MITGPLEQLSQSPRKALWHLPRLDHRQSLCKNMQCRILAVHAIASNWIDAALLR